MNVEVESASASEILYEDSGSNNCIFINAMLEEEVKEEKVAKCVVLKDPGPLPPPPPPPKQVHLPISGLRGLRRPPKPRILYPIRKLPTPLSMEEGPRGPRRGLRS